MERIDGGNLDALFQQAFDGAEVAPSPQIWENVNERIAGGTNWRRLLLWAAIISFAFAAGIVFAPRFSTTQSEHVVQSNDPVVEPGEIPLIIKEDPAAALEKNAEFTNTEQVANGSLKQQQRVGEPAMETSNVTTVSSTVESELALSGRGPNLLKISSTWEPMMIPFWTKKAESNSKYSWAQAGFGTGAMGSSPSFALQAEDAVAEASFASDGADDLHYTLASTSMEETGTSFSTGIQIGTHIGSRWIIQSGLGVTSSKLNGVTNAIESVGGMRYPVLYQPRFGGDVTYTNSIPITNQLQFLTVPVQIGYRVLDRKVGWLFYTGINTQILVSQKVVSPFDEYSLKDSPYKSFYPEFSLGTELNYNFLQYYQLGVQAGVGTGLSSLTKPEAPFQWTPTQRSVGLFLRYIFH